MQDIIQISTHHHNGLYDIARQVKDSIRKSGIKNGMVSVYVQGATAAIMKEFNITDPPIANVWERSKSWDNGKALGLKGFIIAFDYNSM
jgi:hypothetical protein